MSWIRFKSEGISRRLNRSTLSRDSSPRVHHSVPIKRVKTWSSDRIQWRWIFLQINRAYRFPSVYVSVVYVHRHPNVRTAYFQRTGEIKRARATRRSCRNHKQCIQLFLFLFPHVHGGFRPFPTLRVHGENGRMTAVGIRASRLRNGRPHVRSIAQKRVNASLRGRKHVTAGRDVGCSATVFSWTILRRDVHSSRVCFDKRTDRRIRRKSKSRNPRKLSSYCFEFRGFQYTCNDEYT